MPYEVILGNVGVVYRSNHDRAVQEFNDYVAMSQRGYGRAAGEAVWLVCREVILAEYDPAVDKERLRILSQYRPPHSMGEE